MESAWLAGPLLAIAPHRVAVVRVLSDTPDHELIRPTMGRSLRTAYRTLRARRPGGRDVGRRGGAARRSVLAQPAIVLRRRRTSDHHRAPRPRAVRPARVRAPSDHPQHPRRRRADGGRRGVRRRARRGAARRRHRARRPRGGAGGARTGRARATSCSSMPPARWWPRCTPKRGRGRDDGYSIVLIGHDDHEEIVGTQGEAPEHIQVISSVDEVDALEVRDPDRVAYLTQTTLALDETAAVVAALEERFPTIVGPRADDICYATQNRQESVRAVAAESDLVLVVGSPNSSNSNRLVEVARREGVTAHLVEDETADRPVVARRRSHRRDHRRRLGARSSRPPRGRPPCLPRCHHRRRAQRPPRGRPLLPSPRGALMPIPVRQNMRVASYLMRQKLAKPREVSR